MIYQKKKKRKTNEIRLIFLVYGYSNCYPENTNFDILIGPTYLGRNVASLNVWSFRLQAAFAS